MKISQNVPAFYNREQSIPSNQEWLQSWPYLLTKVPWKSISATTLTRKLPISAEAWISAVKKFQLAVFDAAVTLGVERCQAIIAMEIEVGIVFSWNTVGPALVYMGVVGKTLNPDVLNDNWVAGILWLSESW